MLDNLSEYRVLLASKSPRRRELLSQLAVPFEIITSEGIDESYPADMVADEIPGYLSVKKSEHFRKLHLKEKDLVITADTLVILGDKILGKPHNYDEAVEILKSLSGRVHKVITGVSLTTLGWRKTFSTTTLVKFAEMSEEDIRYYVEHYSPYDKAGAYGIQEWIGCIAVESIEGSFYNVMGLPVHQLYKELKQL